MYKAVLKYPQHALLEADRYALFIELREGCEWARLSVWTGPNVFVNARMKWLSAFPEDLTKFEREKSNQLDLARRTHDFNGLSSVV